VAGGRVADTGRRLVRRVPQHDVEPAGDELGRQVVGEQVAGPEVRRQVGLVAVGVVGGVRRLGGGQAQEDPVPRDLRGLRHEVDAVEVRDRGVPEQGAVARRHAGHPEPRRGVRDRAVEHVEVPQRGQQERAGAAGRVEDPQAGEALPRGGDVVRVVERGDDVGRERREVEVRGDRVVRRPHVATGQPRAQVAGPRAPVQGLPPGLPRQAEARRRLGVERGGRPAGRRGDAGELRRQRLALPVGERGPEVAVRVVAQRPPDLDAGPAGQALEEQGRHRVRDEVGGDVVLRVDGAAPAAGEPLEGLAEDVRGDRICGSGIAEGPVVVVEERRGRHRGLRRPEPGPPEELAEHEPRDQPGGVPVALLRRGTVRHRCRQPPVQVSQLPAEPCRGGRPVGGARRRVVAESRRHPSGIDVPAAPADRPNG
jgi:hypothetical protein